MNSNTPFEPKWQVPLFIGALLVAYPLAVLIALLAYSIGQGIPANPLDLNILGGGELVFLLWVPIMGYLFLSWGTIARRETRQRQRALRGDPEAMPVANALPASLTPSSAEAAPEASAWSEPANEDVYLSWQDTRYKLRGELLRGCGSVFAGIAVGVVVMIGAIVLTTQLHLPPPWNLALLIGAIIAPLLIGLAVIVLLLLRTIPLPTLTPVSPVWELYADAEGITLRHGKRVHSMNWQDARLFEIEQSQVSNPNAVPPTPARPYFALWNQRGRVIIWSAFSEEPFFPQVVGEEGLTMSELVRRQSALMRMIHDRTQHELRTMSPMLYRPVREVRTIDTPLELLLLKPSRTGMVVYFLLLVVLPLLGELITLLMPLTRSPVANAYGALWLGAVAISTLILLTNAVIRDLMARRLQTAPTPVLPSPAESNTDGVYILREKESWRAVAAMWLALPALLNGAVVIYALFAPGHRYPDESLGSLLIELAEGQLATVAFIGFSIIFAHLIPSATPYIRATPQGLRIQRRRPMDVTSFAWDEIVIAEARHSGNRITGFRVLNTAGKSIAWRASRADGQQRQSSSSRGYAVHGGATPVTPEELMAIVLDRTGLKLEIVEANLFEN